MKQEKTFRPYRPKYLRRPKSRKAKIALLAVVVCFAAIVSSVTLAYLIDRHEAVNTFTPAFVDCQVEEEAFDGTTKSGVTVKNTGNASAYIRAAVVANWVSEEGKIHYLAPSAGTDYSILYGENWVHSDEYYYYTAAVEAGGSTGVLIDQCTVLKPAPAEGYHLEVEIVAEAVQSEGKNAEGIKPVKLAWGLDPETLN